MTFVKVLDLTDDIWIEVTTDSSSWNIRDEKAMAKNSKKNKPTQNDNVIDCGDLLDISMVNEIKQKLNTSLSSGSDISINISNIERIDTAGAQMLCAFYQDTKSKNIKCEWTTPSDIFARSIEQLGLSEHLGMPVAS